jgi:hypothetical protein
LVEAQTNITTTTKKGRAKVVYLLLGLKNLECPVYPSPPSRHWPQSRCMHGLLPSAPTGTAVFKWQWYFSATQLHSSQRRRSPPHKLIGRWRVLLRKTAVSRNCRESYATGQRVRRSNMCRPLVVQARLTLQIGCAILSFCGDCLPQGSHCVGSVAGSSQVKMGFGPGLLRLSTWFRALHALAVCQLCRNLC